jgi:predicted nuclease of predicted toxin-antitoxin system
MDSAADTAIWDYASITGAVIVTKDEDFAQRKVLREGGPRVVWIRLPNTRRAALLVWFEAVMPSLLEALQRGETLIEVI